MKRKNDRKFIVWILLLILLLLIGALLLWSGLADWLRDFRMPRKGTAACVLILSLTGHAAGL